MTQKYFPINTPTSCQLKWNWSTLYLHDAQTASCHRTGWGKLTSENFNTFHNTEKKQQERLAMLQGKWPEESCQYCRKIEESGGFSDRMFHQTMLDMAPPELDDNPTATNVSPTMLEVFFDNTCNLSCLYCMPSLSSKINQEHSKFGNFSIKGVELYSVPQNSDYAVLLDKFWTWMYNSSHTLKRFNVLGGEPFYQEQFYKLIDFFEKKAHPNLELGIITNLMINSDKLESLLVRLKSLLARRHLKRIDITCSIDCWGTAQEYVRFGIDLAQWEKNFKLLLENKWCTLNINQTISVLTIKTMPALLEMLIEWRKKRPVGHYFATVSPEPSYLMPQIMGPTVFNDDFETILKLMPNTTDQDRRSLSYMAGIQKQIAESIPDQLEKDKLKIFLDEKDRRRNTEWRKIFPWLEKEIEHVV